MRFRLGIQVNTIRSIFWGIGLYLQVSSACAHLLPVLSGTLNVIEQNVFVVLSLPASAFPELEQGPDGSLDMDQYHRVEKRLTAHIQQALSFDSLDQTPELIQIMTQVSPRDRKLPSDQDAIVAMLEYRFATTPSIVRIRTNLFGHSGPDQQLTIKAQKGEDVDTAVLSPLQDTYTFFQGPGSTLIRFLGTGIEHILIGWDHLIFLSTLIVSGRGFRHLLILMTAFTVAHSVTFFLAARGLVAFNPDLVELAIAGTIILSALKNIAAIPLSTVGFTGLVFACGLIHGLGFASSMNTAGLSGTRLIPTLLGFNLGVEMGQILFILLWGLCAQVFHRFVSADPQRRPYRGANWIFLCAGIFWFYERAATYFAA